MRLRWIFSMGAAAACAVAVACSGTSASLPDGTSSSGDDGGATGPGATAPRSDASTAPPPTTGGGSADAGSTPVVTPPSDGGGAPLDAAPPPQSFGPYPSGPYGTNVGDVIPNMTWIGYVDDAADAIATSKPYVPYSLDDARKSGKKYAFINLAESDCPGCNVSAGVLRDSGAAAVQAGGVVIEVLITTGFTNQPAQSDLQAWIQKYDLTVTTVKDPDGTGTPSMNTLGQRDNAYIVDLTTMKIRQKFTGSFSGLTPGSVEQGLPALHALLGK